MKTPTAQPHIKDPTVFILMGVSATGKTTLGHALAQATKGQFFDGDDFHPPANRQKMSQSIPLTDADRHPWLSALAQLAAEQAKQPTPTFIACSALKASYREILRSQHAPLAFLHLHTDPDTLLHRITTRHEKGEHFMPPSLLQDQLNTLEEPTPEEGALLLNVSQPINDLVAKFLQAFPYLKK